MLIHKNNESESQGRPMKAPLSKMLHTLEQPMYFEVLLYLLLQCSRQFPSKVEESCFSRFCEFCGSSMLLEHVLFALKIINSIVQGKSGHG